MTAFSRASQGTVLSFKLTFQFVCKFRLAVGDTGLNDSLRDQLHPVNERREKDIKTQSSLDVQPLIRVCTQRQATMHRTSHVEKIEKTNNSVKTPELNEWVGQNFLLSNCVYGWLQVAVVHKRTGDRNGKVMRGSLVRFSWIVLRGRLHGTQGNTCEKRGD